MARLRIVARWSGTGSRLSRFVTASFVLHLLFTLVLVAAPGWRSSPEFREVPVVVDLVSSAVAAPTPVASAPVVETPPQVETPPPAAPQRQEPRDGMRAAETPRRVEETPDPRPPTPRRDPVTPTNNPAPGEASAAPGGIPATETAVVAEGALNDSALAWYRSSVIAALHANWRKPILEGIGDPYEVRVTFEILRDGRVDELRIDRSSGVPSLDRSALRAVRDADPLPPPPASWKGRSLPAGFVFRLFPE